MSLKLKPNMNRNLLALFLLLSSFVAACAPPAATNKSGNATQASTNTNAQAAKPAGLPEDVLQASASKIEVQAGKSAQAEVKLKIKEGYHINANPASQYQIATLLTVEPVEGITAGQPSYPASMTKKFTFAEQPLAVYEKEATISVAVNAAAGAAKGERSVPARLRFQACDEQVCYPPKNLQVSLPVTVK